MRIGSALAPATPQPRRSTSSVANTPLDSVTRTSSSENLTLVEHNGAQLDLMRRMGVDVKNPRAMVAWIGEHAGRFRELFEDPQQAPWANVWRGMLRNPSQRAEALEAIERTLRSH